MFHVFSTRLFAKIIVSYWQISYFEDVGVKTLSYLDQMFQWDNMQKSQFYKSLPQIIPQLPHRVCVLRWLALLSVEDILKYILVSFFMMEELPIHSSLCMSSFFMLVLYFTISESMLYKDTMRGTLKKINK